jgi:hypothetical protein
MLQQYLSISALRIDVVTNRHGRWPKTERTFSTQRDQFAGDHNDLFDGPALQEQPDLLARQGGRLHLFP